ncbi:10295_t:CDS:2, partial [Entrophospora sp. SA101]
KLWKDLKNEGYRFPFKKVRAWLMNQNEWQKFTSSPKNIPRISYDIASIFKYAIPLTSKNTFKKIYENPNIPLTWPRLLQCDGGFISDKIKPMVKTLEAKGLTIKVTMPNSPDVSSSFYSDSSDTGSLTGGMHQKFDTIHRHGRRTSDILGNNEEELHSSDNEDSENSSNSIIIEGMSNTDIPPLFNDSNSSSSDDSDDSEIRSLFSSDNDIHAS